MAEFKDLFINMLFIGLFVFAILAMTAIFQEENNATEKVIDNDLINNTYGSLTTSLGSLSEDSQSQREGFEKENPTAGIGTILLFSIVSSGKVFSGMITGLFNTIIKLPVVVLGVDPVIISVLSSIFIIVILIGLWILYKLGG